MPTRKKNRSTETSLSKAIQQSLTLKGFKVIRVQSGIIPALYDGKKRFIHCAPNGTPDLLVITPMLARARLQAAEFTWLEVKSAIGKLSKEQAEWHEWARLNGVRVATVRSISEAVKALAGGGA